MVAVEVVAPAKRRVPQVKLFSKFAALRRDPLGVLDGITREYGDQLVQLNLGPFKPYLVTNPDHVEHVWKRSRELYLRKGMMWGAMQRLQGDDGIGAEGPGWEASRKIIQPLFTAKAVTAMIPGMITAINEAVDNLAVRIGTTGTADLDYEMTRITHRVLGRVFLGERIAATDADTVGHEIVTAFGSMQARLALPFVSHRIPLPGDRRFHQSVRTVDGILLPYIEQARSEPEAGDVVSMLAHARDEQGELVSIKRVRDDVVGLFTGGTETTAVALVWTFVLLDSHPEVWERLLAEVNEIVGDGPVLPEHIKSLTYTRMVLDEALRLYPPAWMIPRTLQAPDELAGVPLPTGTAVVISPYLTQRLPHLWPDPDRFDPERFAPGAGKGRHPYAYRPFGGGVHQCLGSYFFAVEASAALAALVTRFRLRVTSPQPIRPTVSVSLRPASRVMVEFTPKAD